MGNFSVSAACVVINSDSEILLIQRDDNKEWQIPGGVVELGEAPDEAAIRETLEETGYTISSPKLTGVYTNIQRGIIANVFSTTEFTGHSQTSDESIQVKFLPLQTALEKVPEIFTKRITDALEFNGEVVFRSHDGQQWIHD